MSKIIRNSDTLIMCPKYFPSIWLSVLIKISRRMDSPMGLYLELNLSKRWNVLRSCGKDRIFLIFKVANFLFIIYIYIQ